MCRDCRPQRRGQVVQPILRRHPAGSPVTSSPGATQPVVPADVRVEPVVPIGRGDSLGLAPCQQGLHQRVCVAERFESPGAGVRDHDADRCQKVSHLQRVSQIAGLTTGGVTKDLFVARPADLAGMRLVLGSRSGRGFDQPLDGWAVHREPGRGELHTEQRRGRLGLTRTNGPG